MAADEPERVPPSEDTPEETTQADTDWPVAAQYQIEPEPTFEEEVEDERGSLVVEAAPPGRPRGVPAAALAAAILALLLLVGAAAAWLVARPESSTAGSTGGQAPRQGATTPGNGNGGRASTTAPTSTTDSSTTTTTDSIDLPNVVGLQAQEAKQKLRDSKLEPRTRVRSSSREAGTVLAQQPDAGSAVQPGSVVVLDLAKGDLLSTPATVTLPRLVGITDAAAKTRLRALGLHWSVVTRASERIRGIVLAQSPAAGAKLEKGRTVTLTVSSGPARVSVPDVTGQDVDSARTQLQNAGFDVSVVDQPTDDPSQNGLVVGQDPVGGAEVAKGSTVTIRVARSS